MMRSEGLTPSELDVVCLKHDRPPDNPPSREVLIWRFADQRNVVEIRLWG